MASQLKRVGTARDRTHMYEQRVHTVCPGRVSLTGPPSHPVKV